MSSQRQPRLTMGLDDAVDRCHLQILRALSNLDITEPTDRACVLAVLQRRLDDLLDREVRLAISLGERGTKAVIARAMAVSPQAVSKRYAGPPAGER